MESFFFNTKDEKHQSTSLYKQKNSYIKRVDISNGLVFFDIKAVQNKDIDISIKNLDRMIIISSSKKGNFNILDHILKQEFLNPEDKTNIFSSCKQDFTLRIKKNEESEIFILFIADFFLKRFLSFNKMEAIDFLYEKTQKDHSLEHIDSQTCDALSLYIINKIINTKQHTSMQSIRYEHNILEFLIHRLSLLDIYNKEVNIKDLHLAKKAKDILLKDFINPPTIVTLAHLCATNESKLKTVFKKVYKLTIYAYIQKLKLEKASFLLKQRVLNIGEIALSVGYKHQGNFSKLFFTSYGVYPKDLLKK